MVQVLKDLAEQMIQTHETDTTTVKRKYYIEQLEITPEQMAKHSFVSLPYKSSSNSEEKINLAAVGRPWNPVKSGLGPEACLSSATKNSWLSPNCSMVPSQQTWYLTHTQKNICSLTSDLDMAKHGRRGRPGGFYQKKLTQNTCNSGLRQAHCLNSILPSHNHVKERMPTPKEGAACSPGLLQSKNSYTKGLTVLSPAALASHCLRNPL